MNDDDFYCASSDYQSYNFWDALEELEDEEIELGICSLTGDHCLYPFRCNRLAEMCMLELYGDDVYEGF